MSKCGDPKNCTFPNTLYHDMIDVNALHWFPMRIRNSSLPRLTLMLQRLEMQKQQFEKDHITLDAYAPMRFIKSSMTKMDFAPYLLNYVFVRSTFSNLVKLKSNQELFEPLRFMMHSAYDAKYSSHKEVVYISDKEARALLDDSKT